MQRQLQDTFPRFRGHNVEKRVLSSQLIYLMGKPVLSTELVYI